MNLARWNSWTRPMRGTSSSCPIDLRTRLDVCLSGPACGLDAYRELGVDMTNNDFFPYSLVE